MADPSERLPPLEPGGSVPGPERPPAGEAHPEARRRQVGGRDLLVAAASGVVLAALFLGTLFAHPAAFAALVGLLLVAAVVETSRACRTRDLHPAAPVLVVTSVVLLVGGYRAGPAGQAVGVVVLLVGAVLWELATADRRMTFQRVSATVLLGLWIPFLASYAVVMVRRPTDGWVVVLATVGVVVFSDIGAWVTGTIVGRRPLAPTVSPNKTWEGLGGGVGLALLGAVVVLPLLGSREVFTVGVAALFAVVVALAGAVGDLVESMMKRDLGLKDLGGLVPGHGGILDRVDAILFGLPAGYYALELLGR